MKLSGVEVPLDCVVEIDLAISVTYIILFKIFYIYVFSVYVHVCVHTCVLVLWRSEDTL